MTQPDDDGRARPLGAGRTGKPPDAVTEDRDEEPSEHEGTSPAGSPAPPAPFVPPGGPVPVAPSGTPAPSGTRPPAPDLPDPDGPVTDPGPLLGPYPPAAPGQPVGTVPSGPGPRARIPVLLAAALVVGALGGAGGAAVLLELERGRVHDRSFVLPEPETARTGRPVDSVAGVAGRLLPSVVALRVRNGAEGGTGSGFVIDSRAGYILTNNHVVSISATGGTIQVIFQDGSHTAGTVVGRDPSYDLAVVKADVGGRPALTLGNSDEVVVGDPTIAIGAPLGLRGTVTTGIVSALNRPVAADGSDETSFINAIQTDAAINPGNSGGPLVDIRGAVIGINSAIAKAPGTSTQSSGNIGLGFTIPSNQARRTAEQLIRTGKAEHPVIGVLLDRDYEGEGVRVSTREGKGQKPVTPGGPADRAGIEPGDIILKLGDRPMSSPDELVVAIRARTPGETVTLLVRRSGKEREITVQLVDSNK